MADSDRRLDEEATFVDVVRGLHRDPRFENEKGGDLCVPTSVRR